MWMTALLFLKNNWRMAIAVALTAISFGSGYWLKGTVDTARHAHELEALAKAQAAAQQEAEAKSTALEAQLSQARAEARQLGNQLEREIHANKAYTVCVVPADGLHLLNAAISGRATGKSDDSVR